MRFAANIYPKGPGPIRCGHIDTEEDTLDGLQEFVADLWDENTQSIIIVAGPKPEPIIIEQQKGL